MGGQKCSLGTPVSPVLAELNYNQDFCLCMTFITGERNVTTVKEPDSAVRAAVLRRGTAAEQAAGPGGQRVQGSRARRPVGLGKASGSH